MNFLNEIGRLEIITFLGSILLMIFIIESIRKQLIKEAYSLIWIFMGTIFVVLATWQRGLDYISRLVGIAYPPAMLFIFMMVAVLLILIQYSIVISKQTERIKDLTQELALLSEKFKRLEEKQAQQNNNNHV
jgi:hypothetical protein